MRLLKTYKLFTESLDELSPGMNQLIEDTKKTAEENGVKLILENTKTIPYAVGGFPVSGYFVDYGNPTLGVAMGKPTMEWAMIMAHESSHMDQWVEKDPNWVNNFVNGKESVDYIDEWCGGKEFTPEQIDDLVKRSINVEHDCEKRTIEKVKKYGVPVNEKEEIQKANSYILFYTLLKETRKWNKPGQAPYQIKEVWSHLPDTFDMDYSIVPDELKEIYLKYCF